MVAGKSPEPLPPGWIEHVQVKNGRTIKYYTDGESGKKFYSKKAVINLVKAGDVYHGQNQGINNGDSQSQGIGNGDAQNQGVGNGDAQNQGINNGDAPNQGTPKQGNRQSKRSTTSPRSKVASKTIQSPEWLPPGWIVEVKTRLGGPRYGDNYKCYISPAGKKFYSKTQVTQFLNSAANNSTPISNEKKHTIEESSSNLEVSQTQTPKEDQGRITRKRKSGMDNQTPKTVSPAAVAAQNNTEDGLPTGWIKELRSRTCPSGIRKDPYYIDPVSGYEFRSKRDVLRYLETGDIRKCVIKPKKRDPESASKDIHHNIEESSSKLEVSQTPKSLEDNSHVSKRRKSGVDKSPANIVSPVAVQNGSESELPPGWIKEYKTRRVARGIRKDPYYTDPVSGYVFRSKKDVFRYIETGDISKCAMKPTKGEPGSTSTDISQNTEKSSPKPKVSPNKKPMKVKRHISKKKKAGIGKQPAKVVSNAEVQTESAGADGLPPGWIREFRFRKCGIKKDPYYIDPVSGFEFRSKRDAMRYLETGDIRKCIIKPTKREPGSAFNDKSHNIEQSASKVEESQNNTSVEDPSNISKNQKSEPAKNAIQNSVADGLPPGWIKEIKTRIFAGKTREDPFYIDPVSGYVFRSKKDALRFIETGDIGKCVMKPSKRVPGSTVINELPTPNTDDKKEESTRRQLFGGEELKGKESGDPSPTDVAPTEAKGSNKRRRSITHDFINANLGAEINTVKTPRPRANKGSGRRGRPKATPDGLNGDAAVTSPTQSMSKTRKPRKTKDTTTSLPGGGRSSQRLAQNKQEVVANDGAAVQADDIVNSSGIEVNTVNLVPAPSNNPAQKEGGFGEDGFPSAIPISCGIDINTSWGPNDPVQKVVADLGLGEDILLQGGSVMNNNSSSGIDMNTCLGPTPPQHFDANKPTSDVYHDCLGDEPLFPEGKQQIDDDVDMNLPLPNPPQPHEYHRSGAGECWSDPCLDFALKTLTGGGMSGGENPQQRGSSQQQQQFMDPAAAYTQGDRCFKLPVFDTSRLHNPNEPSSLEKQQVSGGSQSPMNSSPLLPPGFGLPSYSSMDTRKDYPPPPNI